jgi:5-carboxymethyl-2-hydroxymuconic-semialdehyde dehydrogenase
MVTTRATLMPPPPGSARSCGSPYLPDRAHRLDLAEEVDGRVQGERAGRRTPFIRASPEVRNGDRDVDAQSNLDRAKTYLARFAGVPNHIASGRDAHLRDRSPTLRRSTARRKATAKAAAFRDWAAMDGAARRKLLHRIADAIEARAEEIALVECMDTGQALRFMSKAALRGAENFRFFADLAPRARRQGAARPGADQRDGARPIGPVGVITPWNTPFMLSTWKIAPALAAGCTMVHKPAELSPLTASLLVEIAEEAGLPKGVWNLVNGFGEEAGKALTSIPTSRRSASSAKAAPAR